MRQLDNFGKCTKFYILHICIQRLHESKLEFFLNGAKLSLNSGNLINYWSMPWPQFEDTVSHMCLGLFVMSSWSLTQDVAGSSHFTVMINIFVTEFTGEKLPMWARVSGEWLNIIH